MPLIRVTVTVCIPGRRSWHDCHYCRRCCHYYRTDRFGPKIYLHAKMGDTNSGSSLTYCKRISITAFTCTHYRGECGWYCDAGVRSEWSTIASHLLRWGGANGTETEWDNTTVPGVYRYILMMRGHEWRIRIRLLDSITEPDDYRLQVTETFILTRWPPPMNNLMSIRLKDHRIGANL